MSRPTPDRGTAVRIGQYLVERTLGRGAMGVVYAAQRESDGLRVALKTMRPDQLDDSVDHAVERFAHEVIAMVSLQHPGIVKVFDWDRIELPQQGELLFFAMELLDGETLEQSIKRGPFGAGEVAAIGATIAEALHYAHGQGIVHRDIKPANIFLTRERRLVITDFGVCKLTNLKPVTTMGSFIGTAPFLAPEVVLNKEADGRSDVFSLGALCYNLLTRGFLRPVTSIGELLYAITTGQESGRVRKLTGFDPRLINAIAIAVEKDPARRFQSALDFARALRPLASPLPAPGPERAIAQLPAGLAVAHEVDGFKIPSAAGVVRVHDELPQPRSGRAGGAAAPSSSPATSAGRIGKSQAAELFEFLEQAPAPQPVLDTRAGHWQKNAIVDASQSRAGAFVYTSREQIGVIGQGGGIESAAFEYFGLSREQVLFIDHNRGQIAVDQPLAALTGGAPAPAPLTAAAERALQVAGLEKAHRIIKLRPRHYALIGGAAAAVLGVLYGALALRSVEVAIETTPAGAQVVVGREPRGKTPLRLSVRRYQKLEVLLAAEGHEPESRTLAPGLFGEPRPISVELALLAGSLALETTPPGAVVTVDGAAACRTPCQLSSLTPRTRHTVVATRDGCLPLTWAVDLEPGASAQRKGGFRPYGLDVLALLQVLTGTRPVRVDGEDVTEAVALGEMLLLAGEHWVQVGDGDGARSVVVALEPGQAIRVDLRPAPQVSPGKRAAAPTPAQGASLIPAVDDVAGRGVSALLANNPVQAEAQFRLALAHDPSGLRAKRGLLFATIARKNFKRAQELARDYQEHAHTRDAETVRSVVEAAANSERCLSGGGS